MAALLATRVGGYLAQHPRRAGPGGDGARGVTDTTASRSATLRRCTPATVHDFQRLICHDFVEMAGDHFRRLVDAGWIRLDYCIRAPLDGCAPT